MNHVLIVDDVLSNDACDDLIHSCSKELKTDADKHPWNYKYYDIQFNNVITEMCSKLLENYTHQYPEISKTKDHWVLDKFRFKQFEPGKFYDGWHAEHTTQNPFRILCIIVYLSNHKCGTEFFNGEIVESKKGRALVFPTFWTHTHRGQACPDNKTRYIMNSYANFIEKE